MYTDLLNAINNNDIDELMSILTNSSNNNISYYAQSLDKSLDQLIKYDEKLLIQRNVEVTILNNFLDNISITLSNGKIINLQDCYVFNNKKYVELDIKFPMERDDGIEFVIEHKFGKVLYKLKDNAIDIYFCHAINVYFNYIQHFELHKNINVLLLINNKKIKNSVDSDAIDIVAIGLVILNLKIKQQELKDIASYHISEMRKFNSFNYIKEINNIINCVKTGKLYTLNHQITKLQNSIFIGQMEKIIKIQ